MEPEQHVGGLALTATLFTTAGKIVTVVDMVDRTSATVDLRGGWVEGSIAILTRNTIRLFGTLRRGEDGVARIAFDDPLDEWQRDVFIGRTTARRPIVIRERLAA